MGIYELLYKIRVLAAKLEIELLAIVRGSGKERRYQLLQVSKPFQQENIIPLTDYLPRRKFIKALEEYHRELIQKLEGYK